MAVLPTSGFGKDARPRPSNHRMWSASTPSSGSEVAIDRVQHSAEVALEGVIPRDRGRGSGIVGARAARLEEWLPRRSRSLHWALANPMDKPAYARRDQQDRNRIAPDHGNGIVECVRVPVPAYAAEHVFDHAGGGEPVLDPVDGEIQMSPALLDVPLDFVDRLSHLETLSDRTCVSRWTERIVRSGVRLTEENALRP